MKIVPPISITDSILTDSNVPETDYTEWSALTAYTVGNRVMVSATGVHRNYECLINNTNKYPPNYSATALPEWLDSGATNRWRMFDGMVGNVTSVASPLTVELTPGRVINTLAMFGLSGSNVNVLMTSVVGGGTVYDEDYALASNELVIDWYTYYFADFVYKTEFIANELPAYPDCILTITITGDGNSECGHLVIGNEIQLGVTLWGTSVGILDYSRKEFDDFGNPIIVQRKFAQTVDFDCNVNTSDVRKVQRTLAEYRTTPVVWIGSELHPETIVYGWYKDFSIVLDNVAYSSCNIEVEEFR